MKQAVASLLQRMGYQIMNLRDFDRMRRNAFSFEAQQKLCQASSPVILDVGGRFGETALIYNRLFKDASIHTFEPHPDSYTRMREDMKDFPNIATHQLALGNHSGTIKLHANKAVATSSLLEPDDEAARIWGKDKLETVNILEVPLVTLDEFAASHGIDRINILKLDTQGSEYHILEGGRQLLASGRIDLVYSEILIARTYKNQVDFEKIFALLRSFGFQIFDFYNYSRDARGQIRQVDAIFIRQS